MVLSPYLGVSRVTGVKKIRGVILGGT
jgi:hypothetical protein